MSQCYIPSLYVVHFRGALNSREAQYYLFRMSWIVDRIINVDAPAATLAQQASIEMFEARGTELPPAS